MSMYGTFPRGYAKTYTEVLDDFIAAILYPGITLSVTAQTHHCHHLPIPHNRQEVL